MFHMPKINTNFILLSKVAKEKKYAQEYLGLLARRGNIGSIRIGKRWYTTWEWFNEFLKDSREKRTEAKMIESKTGTVQRDAEKSEVPETVQKVLMPKAVFPPESPVHQNAVFETVRDKGARKSFEEQDLVNQESEKIETVQIRMPAKTVARKKIKRLPTIDLRKTFQEKQFERVAFRETDQRFLFPKQQPDPKRERTKNVSYDYAAKSAHSPNFSGAEQFEYSSASSFGARGGKLAFGGVLVLLLAVALSGGFLFREKVAEFAGFEAGRVAGTHDERANFSAVRDIFSDYLGAGDKAIKESISFSRVVIQSAMQSDIDSDESPPPSGENPFGSQP